ncbi:MAG: glycosyltransferase family 2 protein [Gallionellaceae bacterium]
MSSKLLTIAIPTFNRAESLELLLNTLLVELSGIEDQVDVIIADNASPDRTRDVTAAFKDAWPTATVLRHERNLGPDENFCACIDHASSHFLWIIGDDDLPKIGIIRKVVSFLKKNEPDLLYFSSEWKVEITSSDCGEPIRDICTKARSRLQFSREVNVWVTFISTMIINLHQVKKMGSELDIRRFIGTNLVQLGWVLPLLQHGERFFTVKEKCILAKSNNSGGYSLISVLGSNFVKIVGEFFKNNPAMEKAIVIPHYLGFMPYLIWSSRFNLSTNFMSEDGWSVMRDCAKQKIIFWLLLTPVFYLPSWGAFIFVRFSRLLFLVYIRIQDFKFFVKNRIANSVV